MDTCVMDTLSGSEERSMWCERTSPPDSDLSDEEGDEESVQYTKVVHHQPADPWRDRLRTNTVYSELQNSAQGLGVAPGAAPMLLRDPLR
ncbi:platelet endothelial cell adhesion molecule-like isoform X4 [Arapaima gigas]